MPPSKLVPELRYGGSGYSTLDTRDGTQSAKTFALHADYFIDAPLAVRVTYWRNQEIRVFSFLDTRPSPVTFDDMERVQDGRPDFSEW